MKSRFAAILAVLFPVLSRGVAGEWSPAVHPVERYQHLWESSPFVVATELAATAPGLAERFSLAGFARIGGKTTVFLFDRATVTRHVVPEGETVSGIQLVSVANPGDIKDLTAVININGQTGNIRYAAPQGAENVAAVPPPQAPGTPVAVAQQGVTPVSVAQQGTPVPSRLVRRVIQRPAVVVAQ